jgi:Aspartyl protease
MQLGACCVADANRNAVFTMAGVSSHKITVYFQNASKTAFLPVEILTDNGSDVTLLSREDGERLGFSPATGGENFLVGGVGAGAVPFKKFTTDVRIQNLGAKNIDFGVAQKYGGLRDNLLGREDILDNFNITLTKNSVTFSPRQERALRAMECGLCR